MATTPLRLSAVTHMPRHGATLLLRRAISRAGGGVTEFRQFSNFAVVLDVEIAPRQLPALYAAVADEGITLEPILAALPASEGEERCVSIRLSFVHDEPDLSVTVPAVPG